MKRISGILLLMIFIFISPLFADWMDYQPDDKSYADIRYGYWYSKWLPLQASSGMSEDSYFKNKIEPALLNDVSASVSISGTTDLFAQYISDQIMKKVDTEMKQDLSRKEQKMTDIVMGQLRQRLYSELYITGRYTMGQFKGNMTANRFFDYNGKLYAPGDDVTWYSDFSVIDCSLNVGRPRYMRPGKSDLPGIVSVGIGVRRTEYNFPMQYAFNYGELVLDDTATAVSPTKLVGYNPALYVDGEKALTDYGNSRQSLTFGLLTTMGFPKLKNENLNERAMNYMLDWQVAYNFALMKNDYAVFRFYVGLRLMQHGYLSLQKEMTAKHDISVYNNSGNITYTVDKGDKVTYGGNIMTDIFVGRFSDLK